MAILRTAPSPVMCEHYGCRCRRAEELSQMADRVERVRGPLSAAVTQLRAEAVGVHSSPVMCYESRRQGEDS
jgi:hypothetical protein